MKSVSEILEELSETLQEDRDILREMTINELSLRMSHHGGTKRNKSKTKAAKKARRKNR